MFSLCIPGAAPQTTGETETCDASATGTCEMTPEAVRLRSLVPRHRVMQSTWFSFCVLFSLDHVGEMIYSWSWFVPCVVSQILVSFWRKLMRGRKDVIHRGRCFSVLFSCFDLSLTTCEVQKTTSTHRKVVMELAEDWKSATNTGRLPVRNLTYILENHSFTIENI